MSMKFRVAVSLVSMSFCLPLCGVASAQTGTQPAAAEAPASQPQPLVKGPYLQAMRPDGATICLEPAQEARGRIVVQDGGGRTAAEKAFRASPGQVTRVAIEGLKANEPYTYAVYLAERSEPVCKSTLRTFPPVGHLPVEFAATGDSRTHPEIFHDVSEGIRKLAVPMVIHTGDFVITGRVVSVWDGEFFGPAREMLACTALYPAVGNHEPVRRWSRPLHGPEPVLRAAGGEVVVRR